MVASEHILSLVRLELYLFGFLPDVPVAAGFELSGVNFASIWSLAIA
jgi:hypothetical protein